jgi:nitroreductase
MSGPLANAKNLFAAAKKLLRKYRYAAMLTANYLFDFRRYLRHASILEYQQSPDKLRARIMIWTHSIEKGLALPEPRPGFGKETVKNLLCGLQSYLSEFKVDSVIHQSVGVLNTYLNWNAKQGVVIQELREKLAELETSLNLAPMGNGYRGVATFRRDEYEKACNSSFASLAASRCSLRNFTDEPVTAETIRRAIGIAIRTPSVCNRQPWFVHCFQGAEKCRQILQYQKGNSGFGHRVQTVLLITCKLGYFTGIGERNQLYIEGGLFGMSMVYALQYLGLGCCTLNLSFTREQDRKLRAGAGIPDEETFIFMIAVGHVPETCNIAESGRRPLKEFVRFH